MKNTSDEIRRLQSCINDLISVLALPALWSGREPSDIAGTLLDVLRTMLRLDVASVRVSDANGGAPIEVSRATHPRYDGDVLTASFSLGLQHDIGELVAGSRRPDFPTDVERLLLRVAANQATIGLQEARRAAEQRRAAEVLEKRVAERTRELTAVNEELERLRQAEVELAHVNRVTTMGELTASLAHEVNQPIAAAVLNANACVRWLASSPPNIAEARAAATRIVNDGTRAGDIISRIRLLFEKGPPRREAVDVNEVIREMILLLRNETARYAIAVRTELAAELPQVLGDRVQLQQVVMNLIMNGIDAMKEMDGARELAITSQRAQPAELMVSVSDTGVGLSPQHADRIFNAFFTTKPHGTGMGLSISRSILESHDGRLWAAANSPRGASFFLTLPLGAVEAEGARPS